jgi:hypothetical protein
MLMRILIEEAQERSNSELTPYEFQTLRRAVLGAHSALEGPLAPPTTDAIVAYEVHASSFFKRPPILEEMVRAEEFLRLCAAATAGVGYYVPVDEWLRQRA